MLSADSEVQDGDNQKVCIEHAQSHDSAALGDRPPSFPKDAKSADQQSTQLTDDTTGDEGESKGQSSLLLTSPTKSECAESADVLGSAEREKYTVSIPLFMVRLSRKSKSRSSSKDYGGKCM